MNRDEKINHIVAVLTTLEVAYNRTQNHLEDELDTILCLDVKQDISNARSRLEMELYRLSQEPNIDLA